MNTNQLEKIWEEWEIEELLGEGASGKVYKAKRCDIEDTYSAIKIIEIPQNDSEIREAESEGMTQEEVKEYFKGFVDDLVNEITLLESLKEAKGIVGISDYKVVEKEDSIGWTIYIRMELLTGINKYLTQHTITEEDIINLGLDLSEALEYCEKLKIIHRDIKPENIFISKFGEYKLGDFGIARKLENTSSIMSKKGTYIYMPPEVYRGAEYDKTVDIYSLGLVMFKLGNENRTPFLPKAPSPITYRDKEKALMRRMQGEKIPKPENMSEELYKIIEKMVAYKPEERYQSAKELKEDLEKLKEKNTKSFTGTVNIFTHKSTKKIETPEENTEIITNKELPHVVENIESEQVITEQVVEENTIKEETLKTKVKDPITSKNKKKIIITAILLILIISCIIGAILLNRNRNTEISNTIIMPNLINLTKEEADKELEGKELEVVYQDTYQEGAEKGRIVYQSIAADMEIDKWSKVVIFINNLEKDEVKKVIMPRVIDMNIAQATDQLLQMGLQVERIDEINETVAKDIIFEQDIPENTEINQGSKVILKVSLGAEEENNHQGNSNNNISNSENNNTNNVANNNPNNQTQVNNTSKEWSAWLETLPAGINSSNADIEEKLQYSSRNKMYISSASLNQSSEWIPSGQLESYSPWSGNQTTTTKPTESETLRIVSTGKTTGYQYYHWRYTFVWNNGNVDDSGIASNAHMEEHESSSYGKVTSKAKHTITSATSFKEGSNGTYWGDKCPTCGVTVWYLDGTISVTQYTYQTRTKTVSYSFYKWLDWSEYSDTPITSSSTTEIRTRTLYRYKLK